MAKKTKRARKFDQSGGVQGRLQKGTIAKKGKVKNKKRPLKNAGGPPTKQPRDDSYSAELRKKKEDADLLSEKNVGELNIDAFFQSFENDDDESDNEASQGHVDPSSSDSDSGEKQKDQTSKKSKKPTKRLGKTGESSDSEGSDSDEDVAQAERHMRAEMDKLEEKDPEFHEFLKENDTDLLEYTPEDTDEPMLDSGDRSLQKDDSERAKDGKTTVLGSALLSKLEKGAFKSHGINALRRLVSAFNSACHLTDPDEDEKGGGHGKAYHIESSEVFDRLMVICLGKLNEEFYFHLLGKGSNEKAPMPKKKEKNAKVTSNDDDEFVVEQDKPINPKLLEKSVRWTEAQPILQTFFRGVLHLLKEAKDPVLILFVLKALGDFVPYMTPFPTLANSMLKSLVSVWSAPNDTSEDYQVVRLHSFLRIRQLTLTQPFPFIEQSLKKLYLAYAQKAKFATAASVSSGLPTLTFMGNCIVELYSLDYHSSYQHAFVYIRQLALHLRSAMMKKTQEATGIVYCWQFLHCLKLWVAVLTEACQSDDGEGTAGEGQLLRSLLFPLTQVILGTVRLIPSTRYLPLRLHCVRLLQQLAAAAEIFLPTTSILLDALDMKELTQAPKKNSKSNDIQSLALTFRLRADNPLRSMEELEMCISEIFVLFNREVDLYQYSAGFPEFSVRISQRLRKFSKETRNSRWRAYAKGCLELCDKYSKRAMLERSKLTDVAPKDVKQLEVLRPVSTPSMGERYKQAIEKEKRLEAGSRPIQKTQKKVNQEGADEEQEGVSKSKRKRNKRKKKQQPTAASQVKEGDLDEKDAIEEGINWSDDEH